VTATLTVLRAWHVADARVDLPPFGSFDGWSHRVREPLVWLGRADPCETVAKVREDDPKRSALLTILRSGRKRSASARHTHHARGHQRS
jgi:putative DNA primase/helicase